jgi:hypothetical protein
MKYQHHDTCILCHQHETREHIIRCTAPSRIKWRQQYICALRKRLETIETEFALQETLSTAIAEWLETGEVNVSNYPIKIFKCNLVLGTNSLEAFLCRKNISGMAEASG